MMRTMLLAILLFAMSTLVTSSLNPRTFPCLVEGCEECSSMWRCSRCSRNIPNWNISLGCPSTASCSVSNCRLCASNSTSTCQECNSGYTLLQNNCIVSSSGSSKSNYQKNSFIRDPNMPSNCLNYSRNLCYECQRGYVITSDYQCALGSLTDVPAPQDCSQYTTKGECRVCNAPFILNENSTCVTLGQCKSDMGYQDGIFCRSINFTIEEK